MAEKKAADKAAAKDAAPKADEKATPSGAVSVEYKDGVTKVIGPQEGPVV